LDKFSGSRMLNQNCRTNKHDVSLCWTISSSWSQRLHCSGWGSLLFSKQSAVQQRLRKANCCCAGKVIFYSIKDREKVFVSNNGWLCTLRSGEWASTIPRNKNRTKAYVVKEIGVFGSKVLETELLLDHWAGPINVSDNM
jgi:hypothetical protein